MDHLNASHVLSNATAASPLHQSSQHLRLVTFTNATLAFTLYVVATIIINQLRAPKVDKAIPWVGKGRGLRARFTETSKYIQEGYEKYSKKDKTFAYVGPPGGNTEIVIPRSQMQWMLDQPDSILSTSEAHYELLHGDYMMISPDILHDPYHEHVIHKALARNLNALIPELFDEVRHDVDEAFGSDTDNWKSINVWKTLLAVIPKLTNRMMVGLPLCRNPEFLANMVNVTVDIVRNGMMLGIVPKPVRFLIGPLLGQQNNYHYRKTAKLSLPLIKQRLHDIERKDSNDPEYKDWQEPNDYVTWTIRIAQSENNAKELDPVQITKRLVPINFASLHTTALTAHNVLFDIFSTDPKDGVVEALREEALRIWNEYDHKWTKEGLSQMLRLDSAIRESMRLSAFAKVFSHRKVIAPEGITNEKEGWHAPYGTLIGCPIWGIQHDPDTFQDPNKFDAFRFSREREEWTSMSEQERKEKGWGTGETLRLKGMSMVTTSTGHIPFSHGRHAW